MVGAPTPGLPVSPVLEDLTAWHGCAFAPTPCRGWRGWWWSCWRAEGRCPWQGLLGPTAHLGQVLGALASFPEVLYSRGGVPVQPRAPPGSLSCCFLLGSEFMTTRMLRSGAGTPVDTGGPTVWVVGPEPMSPQGIDLCGPVSRERPPAGAVHVQGWLAPSSQDPKVPCPPCRRAPGRPAVLLLDLLHPCPSPGNQGCPSLGDGPHPCTPQMCGVRPWPLLGPWGRGAPSVGAGVPGPRASSAEFCAMDSSLPKTSH